MKVFSWQFFITFMICMISVGLFSFVASSIASGSIEQFDTAVISVVQGMETSWLTLVFKTFTWIGSAYVVIPITLIAFLLLFFNFQQRGQAFLFVTVIVGTVLSNELLKLYFKRERPEIYRIIDAGGLSFPSGHTMMAFSLYTVIAYVVWRNLKSLWSQVLLILGVASMILMIATSRIYLGVHYPSDIVGGLAASIFLITIMITVFRILQNKKAQV